MARNCCKRLRLATASTYENFSPRGAHEGLWDPGDDEKSALHICHMAIRHGPLGSPASVQQNPTPPPRARFLKISEKRSCRALSHLVTLLVVLYSAASTALPASTNGE